MSNSAAAGDDVILVGEKSAPVNKGKITLKTAVGLFIWDKKKSSIYLNLDAVPLAVKEAEEERDAWRRAQKARRTKSTEGKRREQALKDQLAETKRQLDEEKARAESLAKKVEKGRAAKAAKKKSGEEIQETPKSRGAKRGAELSSGEESGKSTGKSTGSKKRKNRNEKDTSMDQD